MTIKRRKTVPKGRWSFYKATQYRSSWRARCKKTDRSLEEVPTRKEIQAWIDAHEPNLSCYIDRSVLDRKTLQADHILPISRGGSFKLDNIGLTSKRLNQIKGDMNIQELNQLIGLTSSWEDSGKSLFGRLLAGTLVYSRRKR